MIWQIYGHFKSFVCSKQTSIQIVFFTGFQHTIVCYAISLSVSCTHLFIYMRNSFTSLERFGKKEKQIFDLRNNFFLNTAPFESGMCHSDPMWIQSYRCLNVPFKKNVSIRISWSSLSCSFQLKCIKVSYSLVCWFGFSSSEPLEWKLLNWITEFEINGFFCHRQRRDCFEM